MDLIDDEANTLHFSVVSVWEVVIKSSQPRRRLDVDPRAFRRGLLASGYDEVSITGEHALAVARLPDLHGDPFDRLLLGQAVVEDLLLVTSTNAWPATQGRCDTFERMAREEQSR